MIHPRNTQCRLILVAAVYVCGGKRLAGARASAISAPCCFWLLPPPPPSLSSAVAPSSVLAIGLSRLRAHRRAATQETARVKVRPGNDRSVNRGNTVAGGTLAPGGMGLRRTNANASTTLTRRKQLPVDVESDVSL